MFFVIMTDKFMSGWGMARGKLNKFVVACATAEQAEQIEKVALCRPEMKHVRVMQHIPAYSERRHIVSQRNFDELGVAWTGGMCGGSNA